MSITETETGPAETDTIARNVNSPSHYNSRTIQCIEFSRYLDFLTGSAFKYIWRTGMKDEEVQELGKSRWYMKEALVYRPKSLDDDMFNTLSRKLTMMRDEFEEKQWFCLYALLSAANGEYELLAGYARDESFLAPKVHSLMFGEAV